MPPFLSQDEEELKKEQGAPQVISGQSAVINAPQAAQKPGAPASSGQFKNLQTYLDANKEQAQQMGQKVVGSAEQSAQEAQQQQSEFQAAKPQAVQHQSAESLAQSYYDNPNAKKEDYTALKSTGGYTGPKSYVEMADYQEAQAATKKASEQVGQLQSQTGFEQAVAQQYARPQYNQGAKRLDAALIRGEDTSKKAAEQAYQKWGNLQSLLDQSINPVQSQIEQNLQTAQANKELVPQAEQQFTENLYNTYAQRASEENKKNADTINFITEDLKDNKLSPQSLALLGMSTGQSTYGVDLGKYLTSDQTSLTAKDVMNPEERTKWQNLANLIDSGDTRLSGTPLSVAPVGYNKEALRSEIESMAPIAQQQTSEILARWSPGSLNAGKSGGLTWEGQKNINFQDMLNMNMNPQQYNQWLSQVTAQGANGYQPLDDANLSRLQQDYDAYMKLNTKIGLEGENVINTPTGLITGGLKG